jgi:hypothetical protein
MVRVEGITGAERRRRWSDERSRTIFIESLSASARHG